MSGFDDIFESIDDILGPEENAPEKEKLGVSEAEKKMGMWNAQDDGDAWSSDPVAKKGSNRSSSPKSYTGQIKSPYPPIGPSKGEMEMPGDDRAAEDEVLDEFIEGEDEEFNDEDGFDGGSGAFDDLF